MMNIQETFDKKVNNWDEVIEKNKSMNECMGVISVLRGVTEVFEGSTIRHNNKTITVLDAENELAKLKKMQDIGAKIKIGLERAELISEPQKRLYYLGRIYNWLKTAHNIRKETRDTLCGDASFYYKRLNMMYCRTKDELKNN